MPMTFLRNAGYLFLSVFARQSRSPVGLCALTSLATHRAILAMLQMQNRRATFHGTDEEGFVRAQQFAAMYAGTLVQIFMERAAKERKMRLMGVSWEEFNAETEILSGVVYALDASEEDDDEDTDCDEFPVTADMYTAYYKEFLNRTIAAYGKAIELSKRGQPHEAVDDSAIAADQFVENIRSITAYAEALRGPAYGQFLIGVNEFAARSRIRIRRICSQIIDRHIVTHTWD